MQRTVYLYSPCAAVSTA